MTTNPPLELTSVPFWAVRPMVGAVEGRPRTATIVVVDPGGSSGEATRIAEAWQSDLAASGCDVALYDLAPGESSADVIGREVAAARVGWRLLIVGAVADALTARTHALEGGLSDDELAIATTSTDVLPVHCSHCSTITRAQAGIGDVLRCSGCDRRLLIHHHVSRRRGAFLGYMVDAEVWDPPSAEEIR